MPKFLVRVTGHFEVETEVEVEADNQYEAMEDAVLIAKNQEESAWENLGLDRRGVEAFEVTEVEEEG